MRDFFSSAGPAIVPGARRRLAIALAAGLLAAAPTARALEIQASYAEADGSPTTAFDAQARATIDQAIAFYASHLYDPITLQIQFVPITGQRFIGESLTYEFPGPYTDPGLGFREALLLTATSADDALAYAHLPAQLPGPQTDAATSGALTYAIVTQARIDVGGFDFSLDFSPTGFCNFVGHGCIGLDLQRIASEHVSLLSVVEHEMNEVLGLQSALTFPPLDVTPPFYAPLDLFRYDDNGQPVFDRPPQTDAACTDGPSAYFSIDGGATRLARFNNCNNGSDYGDFALGGTPSVQDAYITPGASPTLGPDSLELRMLDVVGWTLEAPTPTPLPLMALAVVALAGARLRASTAMSTARG